MFYLLTFITYLEKDLTEKEKIQRDFALSLHLNLSN